MMRLAVALGAGALPLLESSRLAQRAEAAGFDAVCTGEFDHDSFAVATLLASATQRAQVMTAVTTWARPPALTASAAGTVAEISGNRFVLGLGTMPAARNRDWYGIDPAQPVDRMREYVACVRALLTAADDCPVDFDGRFFRVRGFLRGASWVVVPVHLAATLPRMARLAGEVADGVVVNVVHTYDWLRDVLTPAMAAGSRRRPDTAFARTVMVRCVPHGSSGPEANAARRLAVASLRRYQPIPYFDRVVSHHGWSAREVTGEMAEAMCVIGTPEQIRERLDRYAGLVDQVELAPVLEQSAEDLLRTYEQLLDIGGAP